MGTYNFDILKENLKKLREFKGYSRYDLSIASDIHYQYYCAIESGLKIPNFKAIISLANALDTDISSLFRATIMPEEIQLKLKNKIIHKLNCMSDKTKLYKYNEVLDALLSRSGSVENGI